MKSIIFLLIAIFMVGCASESQQKGLDEIAAYYDANTSFSKNYSNSVGTKKITTFNIKITDSKMLDSLRADITCSNIALMLFDSFTEEEKKDYNYINVELIKKGNDTLSYSYNPEILNIGIDQVSIFTDFSEKLLAKDYKGVFNNIEPSLIQSNSLLQFTNYQTQFVNEHGNITAYKRYGFGVIKKEDGTQVLSFSGFLTFNDGFVKPYYMTVSKQIDNNYVLGYSFE